jgi:hypothetical protein
LRCSDGRNTVVSKKNIVFFYRTQDHSIVQSVVFWSFGNSTQDIFFINHDFACR